MVAAELTSRSGPAAAPPITHRELLGSLIEGYAAGWGLLLAMALMCGVAPGGRWGAHELLGLPLHPPIHPAAPPALHRLLSLFGANVRATCWPLLPCGLGAWRFTWLHRLTHAAVSLSVAVNLLPVGAALGIYGSRLIPYLPQLPLELCAVTSGAMCWRLCCLRGLRRLHLVAISCTMFLLLAAAAVLETWGVPHR
jgi:hypothetical protein